MNKSIENYLSELKSSLSGADPALIQDALWDAETHLRSAFLAMQEKRPELSPDEALALVIEAFGTPDEVAQAYRERDIVVQNAIGATVNSGNEKEEEKPLSPWPGIFQVFKTPKAYTSILYLFMAMPIGIFFFTWAVTGISLSLGLMILVIGIPLAIAFLGSVRLLALAEGRLVEALLDVRMPRRPSLLPEGKGWLEKLKNLLLDGHTWSSLAYLILRLPLGIFYFVTMVTGLSVSFALIVAPIVKLVFETTSIMVVDGVSIMDPIPLLILAPFVGAVLLVGTMHLALALGRFQGLLAKYMLVRR